MTRRRPIAHAGVALLAMVFVAMGTGCAPTETPPAEGDFVEDSDPMTLTWVSPGTTLVVGEPIELAVSTQNPATQVVHFALDGHEIGACDSSVADDDCHDDALWSWTAQTDTPGTHTLTASSTTADGQTLTATQTIDVAPTDPPADLTEASPDEADPLDEASLIDQGTGQIESAIVVARGFLDPSRPAHNLCGGTHWSVAGQRVVLQHGARIDGSTSVASRCMGRYDSIVRRYADLNYVSRASVVAQMIRTGNCTTVGWRRPLISSALCASVMHESRAACTARMLASPDFAVDALVRYLSAPSVAAFHHHDPVLTAIALEGRTRATCSRQDAWHLLESRRGSISAYVAAYNAYRTWEQRVPASAALEHPLAGVSTVTMLHEGSTGALTMIDLCGPGVRARVTDYRQPKAQVATWARETDVDVAANGEFFCLGCADWVYGRAEGNGVPWPASLQQHAGEVHAYWQFGSGVTAGVADGNVTPLRSAHEVIGGHDVIINGGAAVPLGHNAFTDAQRPRTGYGISVDRRTFYIYVTQDDLTVNEVAPHMIALAARAHAAPIDFATNQDGGGSSQLYVGRPIFTGDGRLVRNDLGFSVRHAGRPDSCPDL